VSESDIVGRGQAALGKAERAVGEAVGSTDLQAEGVANVIKGGARQAAAKVQKAIDKTAEAARGSVAVAGQRTRATYERASVGAKKVAATVDPFIIERPRAALGIGVAAGVIVGMLLARGGPKVIYVKPRD
jgi:ElaB/YqjD/DUF883 family membrane-anchored ribosome-binding protein